MIKLQIHPDIRKAATLPAAFYRDATVFEAVKEKIWSTCWHYAADASVIAAPGQYFPLTLLEGVLDEPLVLTQNIDGRTYCLSNVCTHRGKIIAEAPGEHRQLSCGYHGRCFRLDGSFKSMPAFEEVKDFPTDNDNLRQIALSEWMGLLFVSLQPEVSFSKMVRPIQERLSWLPLDTLELASQHSQDYEVEANWALYCDNYLEGFHIPFVHPALNKAIEFGEYEYELFPYCNLQKAIAKADEPYFSPPEGSPDYGRRIYAYYFWVFPNLMFNFYPWGLSLNIVEPLSFNRTKVRFRTYYFADSVRDRERNQLDITELEDEAVVQSVQQGIQSRFYDSGRYSPTMELCVHHFHRLIAKALEQD